MRVVDVMVLLLLIVVLGFDGRRRDPAVTAVRGGALFQVYPAISGASSPCARV